MLVMAAMRKSISLFVPFANIEREFPDSVAVSSVKPNALLCR
jgi:hypothetical protein